MPELESSLFRCKYDVNRFDKTRFEASTWDCRQLDDPIAVEFHSFFSQVFDI